MSQTTPNATDVLTPAECAAWLQVKPRQLERFGVPCLRLGHKTRRYLRSDVLAWLEAHRRGTGAHLHVARTGRTA